MNEILLKQAKQLRRVAEDMESAAKSERPAPELIAVAAIRRMRGEAKSLRSHLDSAHTRTGNGYKGIMQDTSKKLDEFASDLERWLEEGNEPFWAEHLAKKA